jgi:hypothetical protein
MLGRFTQVKRSGALYTLADKKKLDMPCDSQSLYTQIVKQ